MKNLYNAPVAEMLVYAREDILSGSDETTINWGTDNGAKDDFDVLAQAMNF